MSEKDKINPAIEWWRAPQDALSDLSKKLWIADSIVREINKLSQDRKKELELDLTTILKEAEGWKVWIANRDQKIKDTLAGEYAIIVSKNDINGGLNDPQDTLDRKGTLNPKGTLDQMDERFEKLQKNLESVKNLDQSIVSARPSRVRSSRTTKPVARGERLADRAADRKSVV